MNKHYAEISARPEEDQGVDYWEPPSLETSVFFVAKYNFNRGLTGMVGLSLGAGKIRASIRNCAKN